MDWIKLNVDGCSNGNLGTAGAGGILRDNLGTWCKGFAINIGIFFSPALSPDFQQKKNLIK